MLSVPNKEIVTNSFLPGFKNRRVGTCPVHYMLLPQHSCRVVHM